MVRQKRTGADMNARKILRSLSICILGAYIFAYIAYASDDTTDNANILGESRWRTEDNVLSISLGTEERDDDAALIGASSVGAGRTRRGRRDEQAQEAPVTHEALFDSPEAVPSIDGYVRINMPGLDQWVDEPGSPLTPCKPVKLLIPYEFEASQVRIERGSIMEIPGEHLIEPAQQPVKLDDEETEEVVFTPPDPVIYGSDDPYPAYPCGDVFIQKKHGYTILFVNLFPVVYYPASRRVAYYTELSVTVDTRSTSTASLTGASSTSAAFFCEDLSSRRAPAPPVQMSASGRS